MWMAHITVCIIYIYIYKWPWEKIVSYKNLRVPKEWKKPKKYKKKRKLFKCNCLAVAHYASNANIEIGYFRSQNLYHPMTNLFAVKTLTLEFKMTEKHTIKPSADWLKCIDAHICTVAQLSKISAVYIKWLEILMWLLNYRW